MLNIVNLEEIQRLLLRVPDLIRALDERQVSFVGAVKTWLADGEQILINNQLAVAAEVAVLRGVLISAERGVMPPGIVFTSRATPRRIREASAADVLRRAEEVIARAVSVDVARLAEGEKLIRQIVAVAERKRLPVHRNSIDSHSEALTALWLALTADPDVGSAATHLVGLVGANDVLVLLDRALPS
jgi:hypothetical protein